MQYVKVDGGRSAAGYKGTTGDCVTRAIAIATGKRYQDVYDDLLWCTTNYAETKRDKVSRSIKNRNGYSPRKGVHRKVYDKYLSDMGWKWVPTMKIGSGCTVHLKANELPSGRIIVRLSRHLAAVIDGVLHDTYDCSRDETRCVYGYYTKAI
jgi:hypothetical protein